MILASKLDIPITDGEYFTEKSIIDKKQLNNTMRTVNTRIYLTCTQMKFFDLRVMNIAVYSVSI
jgi:hypothetical protein